MINLCIIDPFIIYPHEPYIVYAPYHIPNPDFFRKLNSGSESEKCNRTPDPLRFGSGSVPISGLLRVLICFLILLVIFSFLLLFECSK